MTFSQVCHINNNQIILNLPANFSGKKTVRVIVDDELDSRAKKIALLQMAAKDKIFQSDINEINNSFNWK